MSDTISYQAVTADVESIAPLAPGIFNVNLRLQQAVDYQAGQYLEIVLPSGDHCAFSIASSPMNGSKIELHVQEIRHSLSEKLMNHLRASTMVELILPKGDCVIQRDFLGADTRLLFVAGGTGFSQIKSLTEFCVSSGIPNEVRLYWAVRSADQLHSVEHIARLAEQHGNLSFIPLVTEDSEGNWSGLTGKVQDVIAGDLDHLGDWQIFASGSPAMVYAVFDALSDKGMRPEQMHSDVFAYAPHPKKKSAKPK